MEQRLDRVLRRHGDPWFERERVGVTPLEAGNQLDRGAVPSYSRAKALIALAFAFWARLNQLSPETR